MQLENQTIVITGATSGIGLNMAQQLATNNRLVLLARSSSKAKALVQQFENIEVYQANLDDLASLQTAASLITAKHKTIDILINNAAVQYTPSFLDKSFTWASIEKEITTNLTSACALTYLLLPLLNQGHRAAILNINSGLALTPKKSSAIYCATKAALDSFSTSLQYQLEATQIQVLQAFLPLVDTEMTHGRGSGKLSADDAAQQILIGLRKNQIQNDIGKVKLLRFLVRFFPAIASNLMKES